MLELCRKTLDLLRRYPTLWLPYVFAELTAQLVWWIRGLAERAIFERFATARTTSVLGGSYSAPRLDYEARIHALQAYTPVGLFAIYICIASFVVAFALTGKALDSIREERPVRWADLRAILVGRWRSILLLALIFPLVLSLLGAAIAGPIFAGLRWAEHTELLKPLVFGALTVAFGGTVWLLLPRLLRLVRTDALGAVPAAVHWQGTVLAVMAWLMEFLLGMLLPRVEMKMILDSRAQAAVVTVRNGLVSNLPAVLLFVFFALLAQTCVAQGQGSTNEA